MIVRQENKINIKFAILLKKKEKLRTHSTKIMKHLVEFKTLADIYLFIKGSRFPIIFTENAPKVERKKKNNGKVQKFTDLFSKNIYSKS